MRTTTEIRAEMERMGDKSRAYVAGMLEGGEGYNPYDSKIDALIAEYEAVEAAEWTVDVTTARRAAWNAEVKAMTSPTAAKIAAKLGYTIDTLRKYIKLHNIG
jgi:hypothetical protein